MDIDITPYRIDIPQTELDALRSRLHATRWPDQPAGTGAERGVPADDLQQLARYWADGFDWRGVEARLNTIPQLLATIDGQPVHVFHIRSAVPGALPLLLTHGWPSSSVEFLDLIGPLVDPVAHGGDAADAFDVILPTLPGYGLSTPLTDSSWGNLFRVAQAWDALMSELGYDRYAVQGTDAGGGVATILGMIAPHRVTGVHLTGTAAAFPFGPPLDAEGFEGRDRARAEAFNEYQRDGLGYLHLQATRPQTLAYGLTDSPVGHLAWIAEKFEAWSREPIDRDRLLTIAAIAWFKRSAASSAHAVYEGMQAYRQMAGADPQAPQAGSPTAVAVFAADHTIRSLYDPAGSIERWTEFDRGGHFPALEVPELLIGDLRAFFSAHR